MTRLGGRWSGLPTGALTRALLADTGHSAGTQLRQVADARTFATTTPLLTGGAVVFLLALVGQGAGLALVHYAS